MVNTSPECKSDPEFINFAISVTQPLELEEIVDLSLITVDLDQKLISVTKSENLELKDKSLIVQLHFTLKGGVVIPLSLEV